MTRRTSSSDSDSHHRGSSQERADNIRTKPPHIYDNITRRLLQFGVTLGITTFIGLIVRYAVQEFDPSVSTITVTTSKVNNRDIASLSVSKHFLERILEFVEESIAIVATIIPIGFPICTIFNRYFAKFRAGLENKIEINNEKVLSMIPRYVIIGDSQACQLPNSSRLRPLVRDTIYQLIKTHLKPKLIVEDSYEEARKLGIRIGLIRREHHRLTVIKSVDLLRIITDSRGDIKQAKVRYLLSRMKIMSQSTPADKSLLIYLIKHCETMPNENLAYLGYSFTDPEAMRVADCSITFQDCDDDDVKKVAQVHLKSDNMTFTDLYLFLIVCLLSSNITQSYALYQISASVSSCLYRFLSITVFQEQLISRSQFMLLMIIQQVFAIAALMTKWLSSLPQAPLRSSALAEMSHAVTEDSLAAATAGHTNSPSKEHSTSRLHARSTQSISGPTNGSLGHHHHSHHRSSRELSAGAGIQMHRISGNSEFDTLSSTSMDSDEANQEAEDYDEPQRTMSQSASARKRSQQVGASASDATSPAARQRRRHHKVSSSSEQHIHLSGLDLDQAVINSKLVTSYKQTFRNSHLIDDVTFRLAKLNIAYQTLVMIIIMIFGNAMFQLNMNNGRQHQTLAFNSMMMNNIFNLANCFNQFGAFNLRTGFRNHPFFVCVLLLAIFVQVSLTELNAFGLENLNPIQWFVCFVFASLSALIAPLTGQQQRQRPSTAPKARINLSNNNPDDHHHHQRQQQHQNRPVNQKRQQKRRQSKSVSPARGRQDNQTKRKSRQSVIEMSEDEDEG